MLRRQSRATTDHGKKSSKPLMGCTICRSCRSTISDRVGPGKREYRGEQPELEREKEREHLHPNRPGIPRPAPPCSAPPTLLAPPPQELWPIPTVATTRAGRYDAVAEVRRDLGHAPIRAGPTDTASLAAEGDQPLLLAVDAPRTSEPERQNAAHQVPVELVLGPWACRYFRSTADHEATSRTGCGKA